MSQIVDTTRSLNRAIKLRKNINLFFDAPCFVVGGVESFSINAALSLKCDNVSSGLLISREEKNIADKEIEKIKAKVLVVSDDEFFERVKNSEEIFFLVLSYNVKVYERIFESIAELDNLSVISYLHSDALYYYDRALVYESMISKFICVNERIQGRLVELLPERKNDVLFQTCPTAIFSKKKRSINNAPLIISFVGRLEEPSKGVSRLFPIYSGLKEKGVSFELRIIGKGPKAAELKTQFEKCPEVAFYKDVDTPAKVEKMLEVSDILIVTSHYEGGPLVVYEAMACRVVPITFQVGNVHNIINSGENGFIHGTGDVESLIESIMVLNNDRVRLLKMSNSAFETIQSKHYLQSDYNQFMLKLVDVMIKDSFKVNHDKLKKDVEQRELHLIDYLKKIVPPDILRQYDLIFYLKEYSDHKSKEQKVRIDNYKIRIEAYKSKYADLPRWWKRIGSLIKKYRI